MGLLDIFGGDGDTPTLAPPGPAEEESIDMLLRRGRAGTELTEAQLPGLLSLIGPETAAQLQALSELMRFFQGERFTSPTLERALSDRRLTTRESLRRQLGPAFELSTPGIERLAREGESEEILRENVGLSRIGPLLQAMGLLGGAGERRFALGTGEPSAATLRTTGLHERLAQLNAAAAIAAAREQASGEATSGLFRGLGFVGGKLPWESIFSAGAGALGLGAGLPATGSLGAAGMGLSGAGAAALAPEVFAAAPLFLGCWVARAIYGEQSEEAELARRWIFEQWRGPVAAVARILYRRFGPWAARQPWLLRLLKPLFDIAVRRARASLVQPHIAAGLEAARVEALVYFQPTGIRPDEALAQQDPPTRDDRPGRRDLTLGRVAPGLGGSGVDADPPAPRSRRASPQDEDHYQQQQDSPHGVLLSWGLILP